MADYSRYGAGSLLVLTLVLIARLGAATAAPGPALAKAGVAADQHAESAEIASQIVQQLQTMGNHKFPMHAARSAGPVALQALPSSTHYETAAYYDPYAQDYYKLQEPEPTQDPNVTPSGLNVNGALGFISYLVLLVLLQSAVEGVAARAPTGRRKRDTRPAGDLMGRALDFLDSTLSSTWDDVDAEQLSLLPAPVLAALHNQAGAPTKQSRRARKGRVERFS